MRTVRQSLFKSASEGGAMNVFGEANGFTFESQQAADELICNLIELRCIVGESGNQTDPVQMVRVKQFVTKQ